VLARRDNGVLRSIARVFPIVGHLAHYDADRARGDLVAGLTTSVLLVPQSMAYALLAGLDPIIGLYASTLPLFAYALFGSSPHLSVGPVALVSLVVADAVGALAEQGTPAYLELAIALAALIGVLQIAMAVFRLGFVVDLLSHPVMTGFAAAAALIIAASQLGSAVGVDLVRTHRIDRILVDLGSRAEGIHPATAGIFAGAFVTLLGLKRFAPRVPRALLVVVVSTLAVWTLGLDEGGVAVVGDIPSGLPGLGLPQLTLERVEVLTPAALTALLVGFMEAFSIAKVLSRSSSDVEIDPNRELIGLGVANAGASFVGGYPVGGALSRTTVAEASGARTPVALLICGAVVLATLAFLTPAFQLLPKATLSAIVMVSVLGLVDIAEMRRLWALDRRELVLALVTAVATLVLGVKWGVLAGVGASLAVFLVRVSRPAVTRLEPVPEGWVEHADEEVPHERRDPVIVLKIQAPAFFANARYLQEQLLRRIAGHGSEEVRAVILDAAAIDHLDASAELAFQELFDDLEGRGIELHFARVTQDVEDTLEGSALREKLGERVHHSLEHALEVAHRHVDDEPRAPRPRAS